MSALAWKIGDRVKIELAPGGKPRWDMHSDCGGTGKWVEAKISSILESDQLYEVEFAPSIPGMSRYWLLCAAALHPATPRLRLVDKGGYFATEAPDTDAPKNAQDSSTSAPSLRFSP